jgi:hypothetical protein
VTVVCGCDGLAVLLDAGEGDAGSWPERSTTGLPLHSIARPETPHRCAGLVTQNSPLQTPRRVVPWRRSSGTSPAYVAVDVAEALVRVGGRHDSKRGHRARFRGCPDIRATAADVLSLG